MGCCWYHKGTNFQANHNKVLAHSLPLQVVADTTKVRIFKQITTDNANLAYNGRCCWYHKGTNFQANHNLLRMVIHTRQVVADTTKVRIFKQITTLWNKLKPLSSCCWYHKGTNFQANHNYLDRLLVEQALLLIPQRYEFSSKSQPLQQRYCWKWSCCWYHKGTNFQANHNRMYYK